MLLDEHTVDDGTVLSDYRGKVEYEAFERRWYRCICVQQAGGESVRRRSADSGRASHGAKSNMYIWSTFRGITSHACSCTARRFPIPFSDTAYDGLPKAVFKRHLDQKAS